MTAESVNFFLPIRQMRRNRSEHLGQVATAKGMRAILTAIQLLWSLRRGERFTLTRLPAFPSL